MIPTPNIFMCNNCGEYIKPEGILIYNGDYGTCRITKRAVHKDLAFCEADGDIDPHIWFMKEPIYSMYLALEKEYKINILPGFINREKYKLKGGK